MPLSTHERFYQTFLHCILQTKWGNVDVEIKLRFTQ